MMKARAALQYVLEADRFQLKNTTGSGAVTTSALPLLIL